MKKSYLFLILIACSAWISSCGSTEKSDGNPDADDAAEEMVDVQAIENQALSTWEGHSITSAVGAEGKWVATLTFGEKVEMLGETETDSKNDRAYEKVRLLDGKEGWVRADMIQKGAELAVITEESQMYSRPGISNIKDEVVSPGTLIVKVGENEEFIEFMARNSGKSRQKGWLLGTRGVSTDANDVSLAIMLQKAMDEKVPEKRTTKLRAIVDNPSYANSSLLPLVRAKVDAVDAATTIREDQLIITGDDVNVRTSAQVGDNKLFKLNSGDICDILEKGAQETIGDKTDYWYKISAKGQSGWVFGSFTSKAL